MRSQWVLFGENKTCSAFLNDLHPIINIMYDSSFGYKFKNIGFEG